MKVIGITGGIGAGKSRVLDILREEYHASVIQTDQVAKDLERPGMAGYEVLVKAFGRDILSRDKTIDTQALSALIFRDDSARKKINAIMHPMTWQTCVRMVRESNADLIALESALFDPESRRLCGEIWYVDAAEDTRVARLMKNRGYSREKALSMIASQPSSQDYRTLADRVIDNNGTLDEVRRQIREISETDKESWGQDR